MTAQQISLFSEPRHRATDPDTSREAAAKAEPGAETLERHILERFGISRRLTDEELCSFLPNRKASSVITARSRLKNRGLLVASDSKKKNAGGCEMTVWRITKEGYEFLGWSM